MSESNAETLHEAATDGQNVRVTLIDGTKFTASAEDLRDYLPLAEDAADTRIEPPYGHISVQLGVEPDDLPSEMDGKPTYAIVEGEEQTRGGWGSLRAAWPADETEDGLVVESSDVVENVEVLAE